MAWGSQISQTSYSVERLAMVILCYINWQGETISYEESNDLIGKVPQTGWEYIQGEGILA